MSRWFLVLTVILISGLIILPNNPSYFPILNFISSPTAQTQQSRTYTTNADFAEGQLFGLEYTTTANQLQISAESSTFPFIWVPNSNNATISKIDTSTGKELGRYRTSSNTGANPSRTTVDLQGNCWVGNRQIGSAVKVGLLESGQCVDRNGNGQIDTSRDTNQNGDIDAAEVLDWGQDECVLTEVILVPGSEGAHLPGTYTGQYANDYWNPGPRGIAIDSLGNAWIGTYGTKKYYYINGSSGQIIKSVDVSSVNHTPYGAVIDRNGILWSSGYDASPSNAEILRLNTATNAFTTINLGHQVYGIALDNLNHLFVSAWTDRKLSRINILTGQVEWTRDGNADDAGSRGVAVTADGDVWVANSDSGKVSRWSNDGVKKTAIAVGNQPTGVAIDSAGKVWAVNYGDEYVKRINPATNAIDLEKRVIGCYHYGYSDMTGIVARTVTTKTGTWTVIYDSTVANAQWGVLNWNGLEPAGTSISVRVRSSSNQTTWSTWEQAGKGITLSATPAGRYLQIEVTLQISSGTVSPALYDLTVSTGSGQTQTCTYGVSPSALSFGSAANSGSITVTAPTGCEWSTVTTASWITITSGSSGSGNGTVSFQVQANTGTSPRTRSIVVAGKPVLITQSGTSSTCTITPYPINQSALGTLSTTDCRSIVDPNAYADFYTFSGQAGKLISIELYSLAFDAYLTLFDPNGNIIAWNDDGNPGSTNSRIPHGTGYFVLPFTGTYLIEASSYNANETGGYTLTLMEAPGSTNCTYTVTPSTTTFGPVGGLNSITVQAPTGCSWNALPLSNWISFTSTSTGTGNGFVNYEIQPNTSQGFRVGKIYAAGQFISIIQAGTGGDCPVTPLTIPTSVNGSWAIGDCASGGGGFSDLYSFQAPAGQQVQIILTTQNTFTGLYLTMPAAGLTYTSEGDGTRRIPSSGYLVLPDTGTYLVEVNAAATGNYTLAINVPQTTPTCTYQLSPTSQNFPNAGGNGTIGVTTQQGCTWNVTNGNAWITITGGSSGTGSGTVSYTVAANTSVTARSGTMTIGGQTFTVNQEGTATVFTLIDHMTSGGPIPAEGCQAPIARSNFSTGEARVYHWLYFINPKVGDTIRWIFIQPNGGTYFTYNSTVQYSDYDCQWAWIDIAGFEAASLPGQWRVDLYYNNSLLISDRFNLFSLNTCPTITGISPAIGAVGSSVTITGTNFTGVTSVKFSPDVTAVFTVNSSSQITATVPAGAATGPIRLVKSGCQDERTTTFTVSGSPPTDCVQPPSGMLAWLPGDGNTTDLTGNHNGTLQNGATYAAGRVGQAFSFDGVDDFVDLGAWNAGATWTLEAWVNPAALPTGRKGILGGYQSCADWGISLEDGKFGVTVNEPTACTRTYLWDQTPTTGAWYHVVGTNDGATARLYVNGVLRISGPVTANYIGTGAGTRIGGEVCCTGDFFPGLIDEPTIYSRALSAAEILAIYNAGSNGKCKTAQPGCPTVTGINPTSGATGTTVTISGTDFAGVTGVTFSGNQAAQFVVVNSTTITAVVPAGAQTGAITLTKPNCTNVTTGSFTVTTSPCIGVSISSQLTGQSGGTLTVPILATDTSGKGAISYDLILNFNPNVIQPQSPVYDKTGTLSSALTITTNTGTPGELRLSAFGSTALTGAGTLLNLKFNIVGSADMCTALTFTSFRFNEGTPCSTTINGQACVTGGSLTGNVTYCLTSGPVPGVAINAAGTPALNTTTDVSGNYSLTGLGGGAYTVTPSKTGGANGIASYDAALIAQNVVNLITFTECQRLAGDSSGDGSLSSYDSALIAQYVVGIDNPVSKVGTWKFSPPNRTYTSVSGQQTGQNFSGILIGDVSGNWSPAAMMSGAEINLIRQDQAVAVALPVTGGVTGATVTLPITVGDLTGRGVIAYDLDMIFDPAVLTPADPPVDATGTLSGTMTITPNATGGRLRISAFGTEALTGSGTLLRLRFNVNGSTGNGSDLTWQMFQFNEGSPASMTTNGRVTVVDALTISLTPAEQTIGLGTSGTIAATISAHLPFDIGVTLASANQAIAGVPAMVVIPAGQTMADISVSGAGAGGPVDITATLPAALGGANATSKVTVIRIVTGVSAASYLRDELASESIIASFGTEMATDTQVATSIPLPTSLAGTQVEVKDSAGTARLSSLFFVSPTQINLQIPAATLTGPAELKVTSGDGKVSLGSLQIANVAPGLFSANASGQGVAAAVALRVKPTGEQIYEACAEWNPSSQQFVAKSIDMSQAGDQVYLILYGTGLRFRSDPATVKMFFGDLVTGVLFAGPQSDFVGLDQINVLIPPELTARGDIVIKLEVDGKSSNLLMINLK